MIKQYYRQIVSKYHLLIQMNCITSLYWAKQFNICECFLYFNCVVLSQQNLNVKPSSCRCLHSVFSLSSQMMFFNCFASTSNIVEGTKRGTRSFLHGNVVGLNRYQHVAVDNEAAQFLIILHMGNNRYNQIILERVSPVRANNRRQSA